MEIAHGSLRERGHKEGEKPNPQAFRKTGTETEISGFETEGFQVKSNHEIRILHTIRALVLRNRPFDIP